MKTLGIDLGTLKCGWAILESNKDKYRIVASGVIKGSAKDSLSERLRNLFERLKSVILRYKVDAISVEETFLGNNVRTAFSLGQARGVVLLLSSIYKVPVYFYSALQIKKAVTGYGRASKEQLLKFLKFYFPEENFESFDLTDAIASAICHLNSIR